MKNIVKSVLLCSLLALATSVSFGQTAMTFTSLSTAPTSSSTTINVASATGITASTVLFIEDGTAGRTEAMFVVSISGTAAVVQRGYDSTIPRAHLSGTVVIAGPASAFSENEPQGACTPTNQPYTPRVVLSTGNQWLCSTVTNSWVPGYFNVSVPAGVNTVVASVAGATLPSGPLFHVSGTNAITAWGSSTTVGLAGGGGSHTDVVGAPFCVIPDAIFTTTATNNIALATTAVVNKMLCYTFDGTNKKYVPSY